MLKIRLKLQCSYKPKDLQPAQTSLPQGHHLQPNFQHTTTVAQRNIAIQEQPLGNPGLLVCGFSPDGAHIVAGSNDCHIYAWFWDIASAMDKGKGAAKQATYNVADEDEAARNLASARMPVPAAEDWPEVQEVCRLGGHVNDVLLLQFSHDGQSIATGSKDGTVRVRQRLLSWYMYVVVSAAIEYGTQWS